MAEKTIAQQPDYLRCRGRSLPATGLPQNKGKLRKKSPQRETRESVRVLPRVRQESSNGEGASKKGSQEGEKKKQG